MKRSDLLSDIGGKKVFYIYNGFSENTKNFFEYQLKNRNLEIYLTNQPLQKLGQNNDDEANVFAFTMQEPLSYIFNLMNFWFSIGKKKNSFNFYRYFYENASQYDLENKKEVESFVEWVQKNKIKPLYSPQCAFIDPRKNVETMNTLLETKLDIFLVEEKIDVFSEWLDVELMQKNDSKSKMPFSINLLNEYAGCFEVFLEKDIWLYGESKKYFDRLIKEGVQTEEKKLMKKLCKGNIDNIGADFVTGWAMGPTEASPLLALYINEICVDRCVADGLREDLKNSGKHPSGECGFFFKLTEDKLSSSDLIQVKFEEHDVLLNYGKKALDFVNTFK